MSDKLDPQINQNYSENQLLKSSEAAQYLRISRKYLYNLVWMGKLIGLKLNQGESKYGQLRFRRTELDKFLGATNGH